MTSEELEARFRSAWSQVRDYYERQQAGAAVPADDPQPRLARELYRQWLANPTDPQAGKALAAAFQMWGNAGLVKDIEDALPLLDGDAPYWEPVLQGAQRAYWKTDREHRRTVQLLHRYEALLTHTTSRSALLEMLGMHYWFTGDGARARFYYRQLASLAVDPTRLARAEGTLYELDNLQPGQLAPLFSDETIAGEHFRLLDHRGKAVCIDFWSTDCGACWPEMLFLRQVRGTYAGDRFTLVGVSRDGNVERLEQAVREEQLEWPQIREPFVMKHDRLELGPIAKMYNAQMIPRAFLIDAAGNIVANNLRGEALIDALRNLLQS